LLFFVHHIACWLTDKLKHGAAVNLANYEGIAPLHVALSLGLIKVASYLIKHGAAVNQPTLYGDTPLHRAAAIVSCLGVPQCQNTWTVISRNTSL